MAPFPHKAQGSSSGLLDGIPVVCGGEISGGRSDQCFKITKSTTLLVATMNKKRYSANSIVLDNKKLWVMGGQSSDGYEKTTEYIEVDKASSEGPDLPATMMRQGVVAFDNTYMLIGGYGDGGSGGNNYQTKTWYYDASNQDWMAGPLMNHARGSYQGAGVAIDTATNEPFVCVTAGSPSMDTYEILYSTEWTAGTINNFSDKGLNFLIFCLFFRTHAKKNERASHGDIGQN